jgi:hypothetical protein
MHVPEIDSVKETLSSLKKEGVISQWELPYENVLTRLSAAIFFVSISNDTESNLEKLTGRMGQYINFSYRVNSEKKLSGLQFRITFSKEEMEKNQANLVSNSAVKLYQGLN